jgi:hypothetical protein
MRTSAFRRRPVLAPTGRWCPGCANFAFVGFYRPTGCRDSKDLVPSQPVHCRITSCSGRRPKPSVTRSPEASSPPAAACRSSCSPLPTGSTDKASGFELRADDHLTKPFELRKLVLRHRAIDRRRAHNRPPVREIAGLRPDPFRREVYRQEHHPGTRRKPLPLPRPASGLRVTVQRPATRARIGNGSRN